MDFTKILSQELKWSYKGTEQAVKLLEEGNTIPFIARYRKEATGEMDEETLRRLAERFEYLKNMAKRKEEVLRLINEQEKLTPELEESIKKAVTLQKLEDLYRPYRQKKRTRAGIARQQGLEPLAQVLLDQALLAGDLLLIAGEYINADTGVESAEAALSGACDIVAEQVADDADIRNLVRKVYYSKGQLVVKGESKESTPYEMYYEYKEFVRTLPPHRTLAVNRGEKEGILQVKISVPTEEIIAEIGKRMITNPKALGLKYIEHAITDGCQRLLLPSLEREVRSSLTQTAELQATKVFSNNLRNLLLQPPVREQIVLGIDPGFRSGCKLAVVDDTGKVLDIGVIFPHKPQQKSAESIKTIQKIAEKWDLTAVAIGNGTASRETESFISQLIGEGILPVKFTIVSEAGASVYSASPLAAREFPDMDLTYRSAVSIARRLQDPLAELVKIDPKSIGVGQYQHDVNARELNQALGAVVESCVNTVGVEINTASPALLQHVAGLNSAVAEAIFTVREEKGRFKERKELLKVPRLGARTFQQCAGFIRIAGGLNPFENTPVHPESYEIACSILEKIGFGVEDLSIKGAQIRLALEKIEITSLAKEVQAGVPTVRDIVEALKRPGRDPREDLPPVLFRQDVLSLDDLHEGMVLQGTVRNVVDFGAFVDIGVKQDGLVHLSQLSDRFIKHPMEAVALGDTVKVSVLSVDKVRGRISLTMKGIE
ncbi:MAG: RNA-binding transcriptional accessory protein [Firmicutes bacterium HGW-Firmicutes-12]|jgi:uncharacterized protein|nr:MAG: RNA-binding transcriptional accessory protein [Firmicutes bacterium HGW-Firmicutes-12]